MPRVLITTDEPNFSRGLVEGYRSLGWEVATGVSNFRIEAAHYDVVHHLWPEEHCGWRAPCDRELEQIEQQLAWWQSRAFTIFTVNNLYPHRLDRDPASHKLYSAFLRHSHLVTHFAEASRTLLLQEYPAAHEVKQLVHSPANFEVSLAQQVSRGSRRSEMGIAPDEFVILIFGALRSWDEVRLVREAFDRAQIPKKRLLMAGKLNCKGPLWLERWRRMTWQAWLKQRGAVVDTRYVPEEEVSRFWDTSDVAIVPRFSGLNSGILFAGMTFGRPIVAPNHGVYPDQLRGTRNWLYETGSAPDLASKLEEAARSDLAAIGRQNAELAATWKWERMVQTCLEAAATVDSATAAPLRAFVAA